MSVVIDDQNFNRTAEVCPMIGISRNALFMWLKEGIISDVEYRDRRGWRLFTLAQTETIRAKTCHVTVTSREK
jgi:predicted site-specific integrase-resolvase